MEHYFRYFKRLQKNWSSKVKGNLINQLHSWQNRSHDKRNSFQRRRSLNWTSQYHKTSRRHIACGIWLLRYWLFNTFYKLIRKTSVHCCFTKTSLLPNALHNDILLRSWMMMDIDFSIVEETLFHVWEPVDWNFEWEARFLRCSKSRSCCKKCLFTFRWIVI